MFCCFHFFVYVGRCVESATRLACDSYEEKDQLSCLWRILMRQMGTIVNILDF
ncbi:hypothetical protein WN944_014815 [Citrus x changshan-huyou]|uniref:Uncharacterized protein n=1 Tax=Citrus x changshan-huyou TaxID=2935761 RepID=A0AAP0QJ23_9ROSI